MPQSFVGIHIKKISLNKKKKVVIQKQKRQSSVGTLLQ
ncbi:hypothetical protein M124_0815 [Bacteroides fragilis str. 3988T(B)14]|uniref:Uncharacterized protein n=1 Tax=Bacteroides fragilis str. 3988T(B)14 TaxID=1339315 RepID=A0A015UMZ5_BACFG|nr:hypothetical protein M124_0815 [Bacteroides fragilis str. 3988T(B)14]EXY81326.1 hypothetical protein M084_0858 [Bacteroides fragilis str. 3988 T1]EXZ11027.1 hypothetical protein M073_0838 [Bacteroides fragilis str. DS-71]